MNFVFLGIFDQPCFNSFAPYSFKSQAESSYNYMTVLPIVINKFKPKYSGQRLLDYLNKWNKGTGVTF